MACHEIAALRLGMMNVIGIKDEATVQHEVNEIGAENLGKQGPLKSLSEARDFNDLIQYYEASLADLEEKIAAAGENDPKLPYYRSLLVLTKKVEMELKNSVQSFRNIFNDLDEMHDFLHEIYPA